MKTVVISEALEARRSGEELCAGEILGASAHRHTVAAGETLTVKADDRYHIFILITGKVKFTSGDARAEAGERWIFVGAPELDTEIEASEEAMILEIRWDVAEGDDKLIEEYGTKFPVSHSYNDSIQYIDRNKSEKTISRMMIPHQIIPRFTIGSVESYGYDLVKPHSHPMLDQYFVSFPENDMDVLINGEPFPMGGNVILHIPLGADHGVEVTGERHMHYMWIDFLPDNAAGLKRLNDSHKPTGLWRSFDEK